jgi:hypothetical protein
MGIKILEVGPVVNLSFYFKLRKISELKLSLTGFEPIQGRGMAFKIQGEKYLRKGLFKAFVKKA